MEFTLVLFVVMMIVVCAANYISEKNYEDIKNEIKQIHEILENFEDYFENHKHNI